MKFSFLLLIIFVIRSGLIAQPVADDVFKHLNLNYPGLEKTNESYKTGDLTRAKEELLLYFQNRTNRVFNRFEKEYHSNLERANQNVKNIFRFKALFYDFGDKIDWTKKHKDKEWQFTLNKMKWFENLIGVYQKTKNEKFVKAWMKQIESWMKIGDPGYPRTIDTGRRFENWVKSHWMFISKLKSPLVTPEFNAKMLVSMAQQAEFLYNPDNWRRYSNWGSFENSGFSKFVIMFPEFKLNSMWLREIYFRMRFQLNESFHNDGMHIEVSPSYHAHELEVWYDFLKLAQMNEVENPWHSEIPLKPVSDIFKLSSEALMHFYKPTGVMPQVGDTDEVDERDFLVKSGEFWNWPELIYVATDGKEGKKPQKKSIAFPDGGYYIMRSGWGDKNLPFEEELYLLFDCGTNYPWHAHYDMLNIVSTAYGYDLLKDAGRFTYNQGEEREYFKSTAAHNTIVIDQQDQPRQYTPPKADWYSINGFDYVIGTQNSHPEVGHRRSVMFVKTEYWIVVDRLQGKGNHTYDQYWHLSDKSFNKVKLDAKNNQIAAPHFKIISLMPDTKSFLEDGWLSYNYRQKVKAPVIKFRVEGKQPEAWATILYPFQNNPQEIEANLVNVESTDHTVGLASKIAFFLAKENNMDFFFEQAKDGITCKFNEIETDSKMLWLRLRNDDSIEKYYLVGGSFIKYKNKIISSLQGDDIVISVTGDRVDIQGSSISDLELSVKGKPDVFINNNPVKVSIKKGRMRYSL